jgi:hypothetical protein
MPFSQDFTVRSMASRLSAVERRRSSISVGVFTARAYIIVS